VRAVRVMPCVCVCVCVCARAATFPQCSVGLYAGEIGVNGNRTGARTASSFRSLAGAAMSSSGLVMTDAAANVLILSNTTSGTCLRVFSCVCVCA
jgi:hypothetical protein